MRPFARWVCRWLFTGLLVGAFGLAALLAIGPRTGAYRTLTVLSASMRPTFGPGSVVVVRPTPITDLEVGDVITYRVPVDDHRVVTHRIIEIGEQSGRTVVRTQGDAASAPDPWRTQLNGDTAWRTAASIPWLGYGISALRDPWVVRLLVLVGPLLGSLLVLAEIWRRGSDAGPELPADHTAPVLSVPRDAVIRLRTASAIKTARGAASLSRHVVRWTDDVVSGRRWIRRLADSG
ncbi:MAG: signal peptidase I [Microthrixaceae bacterium]